jgi:hypothetical protein
VTRIVVDDENIHAARLLIEFRGGKDKVEPHVVVIANAEPGDTVEIPPRIWEHTF